MVVNHITHFTNFCIQQQIVSNFKMLMIVTLYTYQVHIILEYYYCKYLIHFFLLVKIKINSTSVAIYNDHQLQYVYLHATYFNLQFCFFLIWLNKFVCFKKFYILIFCLCSVSIDESNLCITSSIIRFCEFFSHSESMCFTKRVIPQNSNTSKFSLAVRNLQLILVYLCVFRSVLFLPCNLNQGYTIKLFLC